jgi:hypothetical protein
MKSVRARRNLRLACLCRQACVCAFLRRRFLTLPLAAALHTPDPSINWVAANNIAGRAEPDIGAWVFQRDRKARRLAERATSPRQAAAAAKAPGHAAAAATAAASPTNAAASAAANRAGSNGAASAATNAAASKATAAASAAPSAAVSTAAASSERNLHAWSRGPGALFVEEVKRRKADAGDVLLVEHWDLKRGRILP